MKLEIDGVIGVTDVGDLNYEEFLNLFIDFLESNNCYFGGALNELTENN